MDTRPVAVVDAFADGPMTGTPVGIVLDAGGLGPGQRTAVADEVGAAETAFVDEDAVAVVSDRDPGRGLHVALGVASRLDELGRLDGDAVDLAVDDAAVRTSVGDSGRLWVDVAEPDVREAAVEPEVAAEALGVDAVAVSEVSGDVPVVRASVGRGLLVVPVTYLEHLTGASPDAGVVADLLEAEGATAVYAYTFDTLEAESDVHGLLVGPDGATARSTGEAAACVAATLGQFGALDGDELRVEAGDLQDRPARLWVRTGDGWQVGGRAVTVLDGSVVVPPADSEDDILEV